MLKKIMAEEKVSSMEKCIKTEAVYKLRRHP